MILLLNIQTIFRIYYVETIKCIAQFKFTYLRPDEGIEPVIVISQNFYENYLHFRKSKDPNGGHTYQWVTSPFCTKNVDLLGKAKLSSHESNQQAKNSPGLPIHEVMNVSSAKAD